MARCLGVGFILFLLVFTETAVAQTPQREGFRARWRSWFSKPATPKAPGRSAERESQKPQPQPEPLRVTTRSGSLRRPGPEPAGPPVETANPTFAETRPSTALAPRDFSPEKQTSEMKRRTRIRDESLRPAAHEVRPQKRTMSDWLRGLWKRKSSNPEMKRSEPPTPPAPPSLDQSHSIDPGRVYRGPKPESGSAHPSRQPTRFSESGVPNTGTDFRGRSGSSH